MADNSLCFNIHGFVKIWVSNASSELKRNLCRHLEGFISEKPVDPEEADIILQELNELPTLTGSAKQMDALYGYWITMYQGEVSAVFFHKGNPDIIAVFSNPVRIYYRARRKISRKIHWVMVFCMKFILGNKNLFFCHGAILEKNGHSTLIIGQRGIRKTQLSLTMLKNGWDYISDDKSILHRGKAYPYQSFFLIQDHHFDALPWLEDIVPPHKWSGKRAALRGSIRALAKKYLHKKLLPTGDRLLNPAIKLPVRDLFPDCTVLKSADLSNVILLYVGEYLKIERVSRDDVINDITLIQQLAYAEFNDLELMLSLYKKKSRRDIKQLINENLLGHSYFRMTIPPECNPDLIYKKLLNCLESAS